MCTSDPQRANPNRPTAPFPVSHPLSASSLSSSAEACCTLHQTVGSMAPDADVLGEGDVPADRLEVLALRKLRVHKP